MNARVLAFPACVAAIAVLDGCQGISITDPSVKQCHGEDTVTYNAASDSSITIRVIVPAVRARCRKAA